MSRCIAVLTRGYIDSKKYKTLIDRNICIDNHLIDKEVPVLIFHEGNIKHCDQTFIENQTPLLK